MDARAQPQVGHLPPDRVEIGLVGRIAGARLPADKHEMVARVELCQRLQQHIRPLAGVQEAEVAQQHVTLPQPELLAHLRKLNVVGRGRADVAADGYLADGCTGRALLQIGEVGGVGGDDAVSVARNAVHGRFPQWSRLGKQVRHAHVVKRDDVPRNALHAPRQQVDGGAAHVVGRRLVLDIDDVQFGAQRDVDDTAVAGPAPAIDERVQLAKIERDRLAHPVQAALLGRRPCVAAGDDVNVMAESGQRTAEFLRERANPAFHRGIFAGDESYTHGGNCRRAAVNCQCMPVDGRRIQ